jgi:integrase/recombinase XerD
MIFGGDMNEDDAGETRFSKAVTQWLQYKSCNQGLSRATIAKYDGYLHRLELFLTEREKDHMSAVTDDLVDFCGVHLFEKGMCPRSRVAAVCAVKGFFAWMLRFEVRADNPAELLEYPKAGVRLPRFPTLKQAEKLLIEPDLESLMGIRDAAIIATLMGCGLRLSGLCGLNESSLIWLQDDKGRERLQLRVLEKGKKERMVPAPEEVRLFIRAYLGHPDLAKIDRNLPNGDRVLFVSLNNRLVPAHEYYGENRRLAPRSVQDMIAMYGKRARLPRELCHPHALRHLYGTELAEEDTHILDMKVLLGHEKADTVDVYNHTAIRKLTRVVDKANPLTKMQTPVTQLARRLSK